MRKTLFVLLVTTALGGALPACGNGPKPMPQGIAPPTRIPYVAESSAPAGDPVATATLPRELRRAVVADAARLLQVPESAVVLARAERVTWSDGSLGCSKPGQVYTQMLVPGYRVVARSGERELTYHTDERAYVVGCSETALPVRTPGKVVVPPATPPADDSQPRTQPPVRAPPDR